MSAPTTLRAAHAAADALDHVLDGLRLQSCVFSRMELGNGCGLAKDQRDGAPFHIVLAGEAWVGPTHDDLTRLGPGEMAVLTRGQPHLLLSSPNATAVPFTQLAAQAGLPEWTPGMRIKPNVVRVRPDRAVVTRLLSGIFALGDRRRNPLLAPLPDLMVLRGGGEPATSGRVASVGGLIDQEIAANRPGGGLVAGRLADYLFVEAVREQLLTQGDGNPGWLRGLRDPTVAVALGLMHGRLDHKWSVAELARAAGTSRSLFAARFKRLVGASPVEYLTEWRMFEAARQLTEATLPLKEVARRAGYATTVSFGRAFKRWSGSSPAAARLRTSARSPS